MSKNYKPLPDNLRLGFSDIHDIGLFAKEGIGQGTNLGTTHRKIKGEILRTPLGGFINHANEANCVKVEFNDDKYEEKWNDIKIIIEYGMLSEDKFFEKSDSFSIYPDTNNNFYTFDELIKSIKKS